jgi:hypothetical protein
VRSGWVAQLVEQWTENPRVGGSIPPPATSPEIGGRKSDLQLSGFALLERMSIISRPTGLALIVSLAFCSIPNPGICAEPESKIVTRVDTATAVMKRGALVIRVEGVATISKGLFPRGGQLVRRGKTSQPNKEGLLEYELHFNTANYSADKLNPVRAALTERSVPTGIKGVRVFAELNQMDAMLLPPKEKRKKEKKN